MLLRLETGLGNTFYLGALYLSRKRLCADYSLSPHQGALSTHNWTYWQCGQYLGVGPGESPVNHRRDDSGEQCHGCVLLGQLINPSVPWFFVCIIKTTQHLCPRAAMRLKDAVMGMEMPCTL